MRSIWEMSMKDYVSASVTKMTGTIKNAFSTMQAAEGQLQSVMSRTNSSIKQQDGLVKSLGSSVSSLVAGIGVAYVGNQIYQTGVQLEALNNVINYTSIDAADAAKNHTFLRDLIKDYKLPLLETTDGFSQFSASLMGSALAGESARKIYKGVATGVTAMHLSSAQAGQVFTALNQMISKGTVQAQELKLQLGNALPGAFQLAAKAMGKTTAEFTKMMENGEIMAADFLPKFAQAMQDKFAGAIPAAINSTAARMTDLKNLALETFDRIFIAIQPMLNDLLSLAMVVIPPLIDGFAKVWAVGQSVVQFFRDHEVLAGLLAGAIGGLTVAYGFLRVALFFSTGLYEGLTLSSKALMFWYTIQESATWKTAAAQWGLNAAIMANPIFWIIGAIGLLVAGFIMLSSKLGGVRETFKALWGEVKQIFTNIGNLFSRIFAPIFETIDHIKHGRFAEAAASGAKALFNLSPVGFAVETAKWVADGGATKGVGDSIRAARKNVTDKEAAAAKGASPKDITPNPAAAPASPAAPDGGGSGSGKGSGGGGNNVTITIDKLVEKIEIHTLDAKMSMSDMRKMVAEALLGAVNDVNPVIK